MHLLLLETPLDTGTEGHRTLGFLTVLGVIAAESDELFANGAASVRLALAALRVLHDSLHLGAARQTTVGVATLAGVQQRRNAAVDGLLARFRTLLVVSAASVFVEAQTKLLHVVVVTNIFVANHAQVKVLKSHENVDNVD